MICVSGRKQVTDWPGTLCSYLCYDMEYKLRDAGSGEEELLASIIRRAFREVAERFGLTPENCPTHPSNCTADWIKAAFRKGIRYFILEAGGVPCGCIALEVVGARLCHLERLAVLPEFRRWGFGKALVNHALDMARQIGVGEVSLGMIADHAELRAWYEKLGFTAKRRARFDHLPFEVLFLSRTL